MPVIDDPGLVDFSSTGITLQPHTIYWLALVASPGSFNGWRVALPGNTGTYSTVPNTLYAPGTGQNDGDFQFQLGTSDAVVTPEPGSVALLLGMSMVGAGLLRKRRRK